MIATYFLVTAVFYVLGLALAVFIAKDVHPKARDEVIWCGIVGGACLSACWPVVLPLALLCFCLRYLADLCAPD